MIPSQMLKGILEGCILLIIRKREVYGYEISEQLKNYGFTGVSEGTIYPLLLRLEKNALVKTEYRESAVGPKRKYYYLTEEGFTECTNFTENWNELEKAVGKITRRD